MASSIKKEIEFEKISQAFLLYDLGTVIEEYKQIEGDVDVNYKIKTKDGRVFLLKFIASIDHFQKFEYLGSVYKYLNSEGVPVPLMYQTKKGNYVENSFVLYGYIKGETKTDWTPGEMVSLVNNFAKLLLVLKNYDVPSFVKKSNDKYAKGYNIEYCYKIFKPEILKLEIPENIKISIIEIIDLLYTKLFNFEKLPKQLVHGDLNEMNAIFKDGKNVGIIDFGVSYDPIVYDLGEFCYWFALPWGDTKFNEDRYDLIVETFEKTLPLSSFEKELLPYMMLRRHMMDIMLALQYYWSNQTDVPIPIETLTKKTLRSTELLRAINKILH